MNKFTVASLAILASLVASTSGQTVTAAPLTTPITGATPAQDLIFLNAARTAVLVSKGTPSDVESFAVPAAGALTVGNTVAQAHNDLTLVSAINAIVYATATGLSASSVTAPQTIGAAAPIAGPATAFSSISNSGTSNIIVASDAVTGNLVLWTITAGAPPTVAVVAQAAAPTLGAANGVILFSPDGSILFGSAAAASLSSFRLTGQQLSAAAAVTLAAVPNDFVYTNGLAPGAVGASAYVLLDNGQVQAIPLTAAGAFTAGAALGTAAAATGRALAISTDNTLVFAFLGPVAGPFTVQAFTRNADGTLALSGAAQTVTTTATAPLNAALADSASLIAALGAPGNSVNRYTFTPVSPSASVTPSVSPSASSSPSASASPSASSTPSATSTSSSSATATSTSTPSATSTATASRSPVPPGSACIRCGPRCTAVRRLRNVCEFNLGGTLSPQAGSVCCIPAAGSALATSFEFSFRSRNGFCNGNLKRKLRNFCTAAGGTISCVDTNTNGVTAAFFTCTR